MVQTHVCYILESQKLFCWFKKILFQKKLLHFSLFCIKILIKCTLSFYDFDGLTFHFDNNIDKSQPSFTL